MLTIDSIVETWSYAGILLLVFGINIVPVMMPPSWIVLASIYSAFPSFNPLYLALVGAIASTTGRFALMLVSSKMRRFMGQKRKNSLDTIEKYLAGKKYAYFILSLIFALGPLPSNMLFIGYGMMRARTFSIFLGFGIGRMISYLVLISITAMAFKPFLGLFSDHLVGILALDSLGLLSVIAFAAVDWEKMIIERKIVFIRPSFRNH
jgi:membrane protein YqaA with SNARE-associated domain